MISIDIEWSNWIGCIMIYVWLVRYRGKPRPDFLASIILPCVATPLRPNAPITMHLLTPLSPKVSSPKGVSCEEEWLMWTGPNCPHVPSPCQSLKVWVVPCLQNVLCSSDPETHVQVNLQMFKWSPMFKWSKSIQKRMSKWSWCRWGCLTHPQMNHGSI